MSAKSYDSDFTYSSKSSRKDPDFQNQLFQMLKEKGVVDKLKSQVRQKLISEMAAKESIFNMKNESRDKQSKDIDLLYHTSSSVIYDYLTKKDFQYTQSVFAPETGINIEKFYTPEELLRILQLDNTSEFYKNLILLLQHPQSNFLTCLLKSVSDHHSAKRKEIEIQTEKSQSFIPLSEKMEKLDLQFEDRQKQGILKTQQIYEDRIISFQRDIEKRLRQEMDNQIQRFKDHELSTIKLQEEDNFNKKLKEKSKFLEEEYQNRLSALKDRERVSQETFQRSKESQERENYLQRQQLLRDMSNNQERELQNKKERERIEREFEMMKEQTRIKIDQIDQRNSKLKELEMGIESRINQEINSFKLSEERRLVSKWKEVEILEMKLKEEKRYLDAEGTNVEMMKGELKKRQCLFNEMEIINYPVLKQQNNSLLDQIEELKQQLQQQNIINQQDKHKINCLLKQKMGPNFEQSVLTNELDRARDIFKRERTILEDQKEALEKRLLEEIKSKRLISEQYSQQQELIEVLTRQLSDLKDCSYKNKMGYVSSRSQNNALYSSRNNYTNRDLSPHSANDFRRKLSNHDNTANEFHHDIDECSLPIDVEDLANDAKHKLMTLDEETEQINKAYHEFKNRLANSSCPIGELQSTLNPTLISQSFKNGLEEGRKLKSYDSNEFRLPLFAEPKSNEKLLPTIGKETNQFSYLLSEPNYTIIENMKENEVHKNEFPNESSEYLGNDCSPTNFAKTMGGGVNYDPDSVVKVTPISKSSNSVINFYPTATVNKTDDAVKSNDSNLASDSDMSEPINLNKNWGKINNPTIIQKEDRFSNIRSTEKKHQDDFNQNNLKEINHSVLINERNNIDNIPTIIENEDDEIDPVVKKYMELVKKKKETESDNVNFQTSNIPQKYSAIKSDSEDDCETIKTESGDSKELGSNRKDSPKQSESESFW